MTLIRRYDRKDTMLLGIMWTYSNDELFFPVDKWASLPVTMDLIKRTVLQAAAKMFNLLGFHSLFTIPTKIGLKTVEIRMPCGMTHSIKKNVTSGET